MRTRAARPAQPADGPADARTRSEPSSCVRMVPELEHVLHGLWVIRRNTSACEVSQRLAYCTRNHSHRRISRRRPPHSRRSYLQARVLRSTRLLVRSVRSATLLATPRSWLFLGWRSSQTPCESGASLAARRSLRKTTRVHDGRIPCARLDSSLYPLNQDADRGLSANSPTACSDGTRKRFQTRYAG
jgi:hypothetical protein